jgi:two-component system NtrC family sensor kinase
LNAAQAMEHKGHISISISRDSETVITMRDQGSGIPNHLREQVFEPFFTTKRLGTGLGLAIVKRLIELQAGSITVEPCTSGASMVIRLPR